ncbi:16S rRNA (cytidine(1402)-2'-O)-methyltransferase [Lacisediminimonas sp.]|uniref:16S rRNA (cytidine(1402)-2'-O)-methyltransferase n=1 Tax=Lacisediminimonas sp. TaxID=3060582 RepID=UPI00271C36D5|nr:16S rRNA (cytidine(1402)-2'-O)-methyltransferase [Lacisediminimonas sp.]MDO8299401.1 16S rRNA (cytidine(1402)-2'-O)-methyltransferase [Lacisediminimonas sp.]
MTLTARDTSLAPGLAALHDVTQQTYPPGALYVVATPVGNLGDISVRALHVLALVDAVACEDTRNTGQMLARYGISTSLLAAHQHNEREVAQALVSRLQAGQRIALVSDAGTPAVSDPGARIVDSVIEAGLRVIPLPGASAAIAALSAAGMLADQFHFAGFLPARAAQRDGVLRKLAALPATLVFYEAPHRIVETVNALGAALGAARKVVLARELTKQFEQIHRCTLHEAPAWLQQDSNHQRGEFVVLVEGAPEQDADQAEVDRILAILLSECPVRQAATLAARITGLKKNALYDRALALKGETGVPPG